MLVVNKDAILMTVYHIFFLVKLGHFDNETGKFSDLFISVFSSKNIRFFLFKIQLFKN